MFSSTNCAVREAPVTTAIYTYLIHSVLVHIVPCHQFLHYPQVPMGTRQQEAVQVILWSNVMGGVSQEWSNETGIVVTGTDLNLY